MAPGINSKNKGSSFERLIAKMLQVYWKEPEHSFTRTPGSGGFSTGHGIKGKFTLGDGDLSCSDPRFPWCCELKKQEVFSIDGFVLNSKDNLNDWWEQAVTATPEGKYPLLIAARNHIKPIVFFKHGDLDMFLNGAWDDNISTVNGASGLKLSFMLLSVFLTIDPCLFK